MTLSLKQKALLQTFAIVFGSIIGAVGVNLIASHVPTEVIFNILIIGFIGWLLYLVYGIILCRLEAEEFAKTRADK